MKISITHAQSQKRLDRFLKEDVFSDGSITRGEIARQIKDGKVLVNDRPAKPSYMLREGDDVVIMIFPQKKTLAANDQVRFEVLHETRDFVIINKPAGLQVHPSTRNETDTLVNGLLIKYSEIRDVHDDSPDAWMRPGIVHRLDKDTSGVMVVAKNVSSLQEFKKKFQDREIQKIYVAIVHGVVASNDGIIDKPIARSADYRKQVIAGPRTKTKVREALTEYRVRKRTEHHSLVEVYPRTGRMHQIRVHMNSIGHPIVGDATYTRAQYRPRSHANRHLLHADQLRFELNGNQYSFQAELAPDMATFLHHMNTRQN
jgi:23S rRNA pseudouridine1911/1915/1917 synthase